MTAEPAPPYRKRHRVVLGILLAGAFVAAWIGVGPIPQPLSYHDFADKRPWLGIPNFGDVMSNATISIVGVQAILVMALRRHAPFVRPWESSAQWIFAIGVFLTGFGSAYYHWAPDNATLVWDRLPMTLFFMPFFALIVGERVDMDLGRKLLWPLFFVGIISVAWWGYTESRPEPDSGDLRLYGCVQFIPVVVIPILLLARKPLYTRTMDLLMACGWYLLAKGLEQADKLIFGVTDGVISGHTLKHVAAAVASWYIVRNLRWREVLPAPQ